MEAETIEQAKPTDEELFEIKRDLKLIYTQQQVRLSNLIDKMNDKLAEMRRVEKKLLEWFTLWSKFDLDIMVDQIPCDHETIIDLVAPYRPVSREEVLQLGVLVANVRHALRVIKHSKFELERDITKHVKKLNKIPSRPSNAAAMMEFERRQANRWYLEHGYDAFIPFGATYPINKQLAEHHRQLEKLAVERQKVRIKLERAGHSIPKIAKVLEKIGDRVIDISDSELFEIARRSK